MADVVNLGQFGAPRESDFSGLGDALAKGMQLGENSRSNKANEAILQQKNIIDLEKAKQDKRALTSALAKQQYEEIQKNRENTMKSVEQMSLYMNDKNPQEQEMFKTTDHYKELQKLVKSYIPEQIDDKGDIIPLQNKDIYQTQLEKIKATNAQVLAGGGQLSPGQQKAQDLLDQVDPKIVAIALDNASKDVNWIGASPEEQGKMVANSLKYLQSGRASLRGAGSPLSQGLGGDNAGADPLGILGGK